MPPETEQQPGTDPLDAGGLRDVLPSAAAVLGLDSSDPLSLVDRLGRRPAVVVLLVDGMGWELLPAMAPNAPFLAGVQRSAAEDVRRLHSPFPSTTPVSLVSLGTGLPPGQHGVVGFTTRVPGTIRVLAHLSWRDDPPPAQWQPQRTWFERVRRAGLPATVVLPAEFADGGLTDAAYRGATFVGVAPDEDPVPAIMSAALGGGLVYGYIAALDTAAHLHGIASLQWRAAATEVDRFVERVAQALPSGTALLVTADHGGMNVPFEGRIDIDTAADLGAAVEVVAGEPRVRYLYTTPGAARDVADTWRALLGNRAEILTREQAVDGGWFGKVVADHAARIGDVVVVCRQDTVVLASAHEPDRVAEMVGFHGSDSSAETAIPLFVRG